MNDHFFLPICFAAAAHGALFFGFTKHPRATAPEKERTIVFPFVISPINEEPPTLAASEPAEALPKTAPDVPPPPRGPEPEIVADWTQPTIARPSFDSVGPIDVKKIAEPGGLSGGEGTGPGRIGGVVPTDFLDNTPRARFQAAPIYPFEAKRTGTHGEVHVEFVVDERGRVIDPRVVHSSNRMFDEATLRAVARWQFEPGRRHGKAVKFRMTVPVMFNLNES